MSSQGAALSIVGNLRGREVACWASHSQSSNLESCVWRAVTYDSSRLHQAYHSLHVHNGDLKRHLFLRHDTSWFKAGPQSTMQDHIQSALIERLTLAGCELTASCGVPRLACS